LKKELIKKGLHNDGLLNNNSIISHSNDNKSIYDKLKGDNRNDKTNIDNKSANEKIKEDIKEDKSYIDNKSVNEKLKDDKNKDLKQKGINNIPLFQCILLNFIELHPLSSFCRVSIISSLQINSYLFVFNILCLFGFNAFIYNESLIEKRIYDEKRNYFDYPMRKEFHKILLSILSQIVITFIIKVIILVSFNQKDKLKEKINNIKEKEINDIIDQFNNQMTIRRYIGVILMTIIIAFFFYYNVEFCEIYINTQKNLVFSWIWSLFFEWVILAPIYIVIISALENKKSNLEKPSVFYLKRLFFF